MKGGMDLVSNGAGPDRAALRIEGADVGYGDVQVLRNVNLNVDPSQAVAVLGPNGAGKTTLLRYASGLLRGTSGHLYVDGTDMTGVSSLKLAKSGVCHIPQGRGLYPSLTVRENMSLFSPRRSPDELVEDTVRVFPALGARLNQVAGTLSGGEQQMLALGRAYATSPAVVLLDEVSMGLAPRIVDSIFESIQILQNENVALLLVEQYVDRALAIADYVYVLNNGLIDAEGPAKDFTRDRVRSAYLGQ